MITQDYHIHTFEIFKIKDIIPKKNLLTITIIFKDYIDKKNLSNQKKKISY